MKNIMKKNKWLLFIMVTVVMLTGCNSGNSDKDKIGKLEDLEGKSIGTITFLDFDDEKLLEMFTGVYDTEFKSIESFDTEASLIMGLDSGKVQAAWLRSFQADVYIKDQDKYTTIIADADRAVPGSARMVASKDTQAALDMEKINEAIAELKEDGSIAEFQKEYIDNFSFTNEYESLAMPKIEGGPTYKVSVSGSMVPLDYIAADGNPTGFSIALLSKISEVANLNFELVMNDVGTNMVALNSEKVDYIFAYTITDENISVFPDLVFSDPYYSYPGTAMLIKK